MHQPRIRGPDHAVSAFGDAQAEINIAAFDGQHILLDTAHQPEHIGSDGQAGSGDCRDFANMMQSAEMDGIIGVGIAHDVIAASIGRQRHSGML
ncbi:MAG: hypothetical protein BGO51_11270 [Rhodospirillales bacterium 69-11]|nr:MAG: hypothetical protein BGO51_11270 [Rhodospirillales bacterium 69-11]